MLKKIIINFILRKLSFFLTAGATVALLLTLFIPGRSYSDIPDTASATYFLIASLVLTCTGILRAGFSKVDRMQFNAGDLLVLLLLICVTLGHFIPGGTPQAEWWLLLSLFAVYLNVRLYISAEREKAAGNVILVLLLAGLAEEIVAFCQLAGWTSSAEIRGTFPHGEALGGFLCVAFATALYQIASRYEKVRLHCKLKGWKTLLKGEGALFSLAVLTLLGAILLMPAADSRACWLAAIVSVISIIVTLEYGETLRQWMAEHRGGEVMAGLGVATALVLLVFISYGTGGKADGRHGAERKVAMEVIREHPVTGVGLGNYTEAAAAVRMPGTQGEAATAFSDYLECWAELGLIGLMLFAGIIALAFRGYIKNLISGRALPMALLALLTYALVSYPLQLLSFRLLSTILLAGGLSVWFTERCFPCRRWQAVVLIGVALVINVLALIFV